MSEDSALPDNISELLDAWSGGDREAWNRLVPLVYNELRGQAHRFLRHERAGHSLQTTALVHETYLKMVEQREVRWDNRKHFFWLAAEIMRRILVDYARQRNRQKRGGEIELLPLDSTFQIAAEETEIDLLALDEALNKLAQFDAQQAKVVELRFFSGLNIEETAEALSVSPATVKRDWAMAKAWLFHELSGADENLNF
jgi:RNA polymerase sigma factor (TIGR02999 family)